MDKTYKLTVEDLTADIVEQMKQAIRNDTKMIELQQKRNVAIRSRDYVNAQKLSKLISEVENRVINTYLNQYEGEAEHMDELMKGMDEKDVDALVTHINAVMLLSDMMDTFTMECNEIIRRYHPDYRIEMFDKIAKIGHEAREHIRFMSECTDWNYQTSFADVGDDVTQLVLNKSRALSRKMESKNKTA